MHFLPSKTTYLLLYTCLLLLFRIPIRAQVVYLCQSPGNYNNGSTYQTNLNLVLQFLNTKISFNYYSNTSFGVDPDQVYGHAQCRSDVSTSSCQDCLKTSTVQIIRDCANKNEAFITYDECLLRYSQRRFFSEPDLDPEYSFPNPNTAKDPELFDQRVRELMTNLSSTDLTPFMFATSSMTTPEFTIYGSVECVRDISSKDCQSCLKSMIDWIPNCCSGKLGGQVLSLSCHIRYEVYPFIQAPSPRSPFPTPPQVLAPPPPPPPPSVATPQILAPRPPPPVATPPVRAAPLPRPHPGNQSRIIIIIVVVLVLGLALFGSCIYWHFGSCIYRHLQRRHRRLEDREEDHHASSHHVGTQNGLESVNESMQGDQTPEVPIIDFASIQAATNNFSDENKLGEGGFGPVYKGMLSGKEIAVKRLSRSSGQGLEEFKNEVTLIAKLQHRNLVSLLYWCIDGGEKLLIYEYMPNTSLDVFIFDPIKRRQLGWEGLHNIIGGIVKGLVYLHEDSRLRIIHRDLKASNVLLDHEMKPKISDFGMARFLGGDQSQVNTDRVVGTIGYMAPEYIREGLFSVKSDVYSFGVLLLEIVSGKRNNSPHLPEDAVGLVTYAWGLWCNGRATELIDPLLADCPTNKVARWIHIGLLCVQQDAADRPTMSSVIVMLGSKSTTIQQPKQPGIYFGGLSLNQINLSTSARIGSNNDVTISALEPR